ncbi:GGDEF domain-containing protein [Thermodesulfobacteriota bacterium]
MIKADESRNLECPLKESGCPLVDELRLVKEEVRRLEDLSYMDTLTGYFNYRYLLTALEAEMERSRRTGLSTGLIMVDLDHFKGINDEFGHENGNLVLQRSSELWRKNLRRIDVPCRYGGEEFVIILPGSRLSQSVNVAERLRLVLESSPITLDGKPVKVTASFGVDSYSRRENVSVEEFIKRTDDFLLEAKAAGRNSVCYDRQKTIINETEITGDEREALYGTVGFGNEGSKS